MIGLAHRAVLPLLLFLPAAAVAAVGRTPTAFQVSQIGEATYSVPIFTPPGTGAVTPQLALVYGHASTSTLLGVGWGISGLSSITRCPRTWAQDGGPRDVRNDYSDKFCLDGNRLRLVSGAYGNPGAEYRTEIETFARVISYGSAGNGPAYFEVHRKDGLIYQYGNSADSRIESVGQATARTWALSGIRDRSGNEALFTYAEDTVHGAFRIDLIQYTRNVAQGLSPAYAVDFVYEDKLSSEIDSAYIAGSVVKEIKRLDRIVITHGGSPVRTYELTYETLLSSTSKSRLASIQECAPGDCLPPTTFAYQNGSHGLAAEGVASFAPPTTPGYSPWPMDVNGDGRDDLVYVSSVTAGAGHWWIAFANASGGYDPPANTNVVNHGFLGAIPIDYNADGLRDLLVPYSGGTWWVMLASASGLGAPVNTGTPATGTGRAAAAIDVNGDGLDDLVWADIFGYSGGDAIRYRLRVPGGTFEAGATTLVGPMPVDTKIDDFMFPVNRAPYQAPDFNGDGRSDIAYKSTTRIWDDEFQRYVAFQFSMTGVCVGAWQFGMGGASITAPVYADFNGDGKTDLFYWDGGPSLKYWLSRGTGTGSTMTGPLKGGYSTNWFIVDWDGDGNDDVMLEHGPTATWHVMRSTGEVFAAPVSTSIPSGTIPTVADIDGNGLSDVAYMAGGTWRYRLHAGIYPDLLQTATDGFGNFATFNYAALNTANYTKYADAPFPEQDVNGALYVVNTAVASNGIGGSFTQSFHYFGARLHLQGRGFEGFYAMYRHDSRTGVYTYDYFRRDFPFTGLNYWSDTYQPSGQLISRIQRAPGYHSYGSGFDVRYFPVVSSDTITEYEVGGAYNSAHTRTVATNRTFDPATGTLTDQVTTTTEPATANGVQAGASYEHRTYIPSLYSDWGNWCIGRPALTQQINSHNMYGGGSQIRQTSTVWNGLTCRATQLQEQPGDPQWQVTIDVGYDGYGNVSSQTVTGVGMAARTTSTTWAAPGTFPTSVTLPVSASSSMIVQKSWNYALGVQASETDPNGLVTSWTHDGFGRRTLEVRPDGTDTTWAYHDCTAVSGGCVSGNNKMTVIQTMRDTGDMPINDVWTYTDRFDRPIVTSTRQPLGSYNRQDTIYDALGRVFQRSAPCFWASCTYYWTTYQYDLLNRPVQESRPVSDTDPTLQTSYVHYEGLTTRTIDPLGKESRRVATVTGAAGRSIDDNGHYQHFDYDAFGNLLRVQDALGATLQSNTYNIRGMRLTSSDIDRGNWTFVPNAVGELTSQTDANGKTLSFTYDYQGRQLTRTMPEGGGSITHTFMWGISPAAKNVGRLEWMQTSGTGVTMYRETYTYDSLARPSQTQYTEGATNYFVNFAYNSTTGFLEQITYPVSTDGFRFKIRYDYQYGYPQRVWNFDNNNNFWVANAADARGNITTATLMEATNTTTFTQVSTYDRVTGLLQARQSTLASGTAIENQGFLWDRVGNLTQRQDNRQGLTENFYYDNLHRLDYSQLNGSTNLDLAYDARGNITSKSGVGTYTYHPTKIHAVASINTGGGTLTYSYDAAGNVTNRNGTAISWYGDNLAKAITKDASNSSTFEYAPNGQRWRHVYRTAGANYTHTYIGGLVEKVVGPTNTSWKHFVYVNGEAISVYIRTSSGAKDRYFFVKDHLGSPAALVHGDGPIPLRESFDAFGKRRGTAWTGAPTSGQLTTANTISRRGFTFHEHLDSTDLIHMNGRVYDPLIGRFVSADPFIDCWWDTQSYNRYAYVKNNPLSAIDPSGFKPKNPRQTACQNTCPANGGGGGGTASGGAGGAGPLETVEVRGSRDVGAADFGLGGGFGGVGSLGSAGGEGGGGGLETVTVTGQRVPAPQPPRVNLTPIALSSDSELVPRLRYEHRYAIEDRPGEIEECVNSCMTLLMRGFIVPIAQTAGGFFSGGLAGALGGASGAWLESRSNSLAASNAGGAAAAGFSSGLLDRQATAASTVRRARAGAVGSVLGTSSELFLGNGIFGTSTGYMLDGYASAYMQARWNNQGMSTAHAAGLRGVRAGYAGALADIGAATAGSEVAKSVCDAQCD